MVLSLILTFLIPTFGPQDPLPKAEALLEIVDSAQAEFENITFVYEGGSKILHPGSHKPGKPFRAFPDFQGVFTYRTADDSCHDYKFLYTPDGLPPTTAVASLLGGGMTRETTRTAGQNGEIPEQVSPGGLFAWDRPMVPFRFFYRPLFRDLLFSSVPREARSNPDQRYACLGWEVIDNRRLLKVRLHSSQDSPSEPKEYSLYWLDLERGSHPIRCEFYENGRIRGRIDSIPLAQFPARGGREVWFPVAGRELSYHGKSGISDEPQIETDYQVVAGTVRLDQGLSDRRFDLSHVPDELTGPLKKMRENFRKEARESQTQASVEKRIDKALEETRRSGREIEAPSPGRSEERRVSILSYTVLGLGVVCLGVGFVLWRRR